MAKKPKTFPSTNSGTINFKSSQGTTRFRCLRTFHFLGGRALKWIHGCTAALQRRKLLHTRSSKCVQVRGCSQMSRQSRAQTNWFPTWRRRQSQFQSLKHHYAEHSLSLARYSKTSASRQPSTMTITDKILGQKKDPKETVTTKTPTLTDEPMGLKNHTISRTTWSSRVTTPSLRIW